MYTTHRLHFHFKFYSFALSLLCPRMAIFRSSRAAVRPVSYVHLASMSFFSQQLWHIDHRCLMPKYFHNPSSQFYIIGHRCRSLVQLFNPKVNVQLPWVRTITTKFRWNVIFVIRICRLTFNFVNTIINRLHKWLCIVDLVISLAVDRICKFACKKIIHSTSHNTNLIKLFF